MKAFKWIAVSGLLYMVVFLGYNGYQYVTRTPAPYPVDTTVSVEASPSPSPSSPFLDSVHLAVPFTPQAPLGDWANHQESCEEANLAQITAFYSGNHSQVLDAHSADKTIRDLVNWEVKNWGGEYDLTDQRLGELAKGYYGYDYQVLPFTREGVLKELDDGHPVILGVTTHGLGNPDYPGYDAHYLQKGYSVSHFVTLVGYDDQGFILNDPGLTKGRGYHVGFIQLTFAIGNLDQQRPELNEGQVMLIVKPHTGA